MANIKLDASQTKKRFTIPTEPNARRDYYLGLIETYKGQNPVKYELKREELQKKADGWVYTFDSTRNMSRWMLLYPLSGEPEVIPGEVKKTPQEKQNEADRQAILAAAKKIMEEDAAKEAEKKVEEVAKEEVVEEAVEEIVEEAEEEKPKDKKGPKSKKGK